MCILIIGSDFSGKVKLFVPLFHYFRLSLSHFFAFFLEKNTTTGSQLHHYRRIFHLSLCNSIKIFLKFLFLGGNVRFCIILKFHVHSIRIRNNSQRRNRKTFGKKVLANVLAISLSLYDSLSSIWLCKLSEYVLFKRE